MSLLMKALEKAAKDREGGDAPPAAPSGGLELEPIAAAPRETAAAAPAPARPAAAGESPTRTGAPAAPSPAAQAATVVNAGRRGSASGGAGAYLRARPMLVFALAAGLAIAGYGSYVYVQLFHPGLLSRQAAPVAQVTPPPKQATPPAAPAAPAETLSPLTLADTDPAPARGSLAPAAKPPVAAAATAATAAAAGPAPKPAATPAPAPAAAPPAAAAAIVTAPAQPRDAIRVTAGTTAPVVNPLLTDAYAALNAGNYDAAQRTYEQVLRSDPGNVDALLGLAAIATQRGNSDEAMRRHLKVLELDPRNAAAQAGLIGIVGSADPLAAETRLKTLIAREPATAYLHFALGLAYVDQKRWPDAQQAFFRAHELQTDNPDFAYNLAVSLEHIGQPRAALDFYRRAVQLAGVRGRSNFNVGAAEQRVGKLEAALR